MYYLILAILTGLMMWIAAESGMLRNTVFNDANFHKVAHKSKNKKPKASFSLGRSQLAFWTVIVAASFVYLLLSQSAYPEIDVPVLDSVNLALIGLAAGTTLISKAIDLSQKNNQGEAIPQQDYPSEGFFIDIISDEQGVSIHRLQNVLWTLVVGGIYIAFVSGHTTLPDATILTPNLLALMGISTGAYLGLKLNENKSPATTPETVNEALAQDSTPLAPPPAVSPQQPIVTTATQPDAAATPVAIDTNHTG